MGFKKYKGYPEYKNSGVEWIGDVPEHWKLYKIAWHMPFSIGWTPPTNKDEFYNGENLWVSIADMTENKIINDTKTKITEIAVKEKGASKVPKGSMLFSFKLSVGIVSFLEKDAYINEAIAAFQPNQNLSLRYWYYAGSIFIPKYGRENIYGALLLNQDLIRSVRFSAPPFPEQHQIASFLDHKTSKVDQLIQEKHELIDLLKKKKTALITKCVTKGLDDNVPMKDSGVEWIGDIPEGWDVVPLKYLSDFINGYGFKPEDWKKEGIPIIRIENLNKSNNFNKTDKQVPRKYHVKKGDLLFGWSGNRGTSFGIFIWNLDGLYYLNQHIFLVKKRNIYNTNKTWFYWALRATTNYIEQQAHGIIGMVHVTRSKLGKVYIVVPSINEQHQIADYLDHQTAKIDQTIQEVQESIDLLQKYKTSLITHAVTGKIDVRDWDKQAQEHKEAAYG